MDLGGIKMVNFTLNDFLIQYSLLSVPFMLLIGMFVLSKLRMSDN